MVLSAKSSLIALERQSLSTQGAIVAFVNKFSLCLHDHQHVSE